MSARYVQGDAHMLQQLPVATAQYVEYMDAVALQGGTIVRAQDITWGTTVATPTAPTVADTGSDVNSELTNAATGVKISYQFPWGEGTLSTAGSATPTAQAGLYVTGASLVPGTNAMWTNVYVETAAGSGVYKLWGTTTGSPVTVLSYGAGRVPPTAVATTDLQQTQYAFAQLFMGISNQRKCSASGPNQAFFGNNAWVFGNSSPNTIQILRGGVFEFDCASATFTPGQYVGMAKDTGDTLLNQTVVLVADRALSIGRVVTGSNVGGVLGATTKVMVEVVSSYTPVPAVVVS